MKPPTTQLNGVQRLRTRTAVADGRLPRVRPAAADAGLICGECQRSPPAFHQVTAPWTYSFPVDSLISRFKHQGKWPLGHLLANLLGQCLQDGFDNAELTRPDACFPYRWPPNACASAATTKPPCSPAG
jgi:predicted amidophosphoribosyltransferase